MKVFDSQVMACGLTEKAVRETIRICTGRNILKKYLEGRKSEAVDIMLTLFSQEEVWNMSIRSAEKNAAIKTTIEDGKYYGASRQDIIVRIMEKFGISQSDADKMMETYW